MSQNLPMPRRPVSRNRLHQQIADQLVGDIVNGSPAAGELLPSEPRLTEQYGVSRTVMRQALMSVEAKGLISIEHGRGNRVLPRESWNIFDEGVIEALRNSTGVADILTDLLETRWMFEVEAAGLAAQRGSDETDRLTESVEEMATSLDDPASYFRHDVEFHARLLDAAHNQVLKQLMEPVKGLLEVARMEVVSISSREGREKSLEGHRLIVAAVQAGDPDAARQAMVDHLGLTKYELGLVQRRVQDEQGVDLSRLASGAS